MAEPDFLLDPRLRVEHTIVLQPGSHSLRIGRATDEEPTLVPHVLARLYKGNGHSTDSSPSYSPANEKERERELLEAQRALQRYAGPARKSASSGSLSADAIEEEIIDDATDAFEFIGLTSSSGEQDAPSVVCGEQALRVSGKAFKSGARYVMRRPMVCGRLQARSSVEEALNELETIWTHAVCDVLAVPKEQMAQLSCMLIVPANVCKTDVKTMVHVLLSRMSLSAVCVLQDAACASFQANTATACIVDLGHTKTSVSVVEEGCCIPCCCYHLPYGAHDISRVLLWLLQRGGWGGVGGDVGGGGQRDGTRGARGKGGGAAALEGYAAEEPAHAEELTQFRERVCYLLGPQQDVLSRTDQVCQKSP